MNADDTDFLEQKRAKEAKQKRGWRKSARAAVKRSICRTDRDSGRDWLEPSRHAKKKNVRIMIELVEHAEGVILPVRAQPGAAKNGVRGEQNGMLKVCVTQVAERGKANRAIVEVLAEALGVRRSQIELVAGELQPLKRFLIRGVTVEELRGRLDGILSSS